MKCDIKCVALGSFRKNYDLIIEVVSQLEKFNVKVLSPEKSKVVNPGDDFIILTSDTKRFKVPTIRKIENVVLARIHVCDFVYVVNPGGEIGITTSFEIGYAKALKRPIIAMEAVSDSTLAEFVDYVLQPVDIKKLLIS